MPVRAGTHHPQPLATLPDHRPTTGNRDRVQGPHRTATGARAGHVGVMKIRPVRSGQGCHRRGPRGWRARLGRLLPTTSTRNHLMQSPRGARRLIYLIERRRLACCPAYISLSCHTGHPGLAVAHADAQARDLAYVRRTSHAWRDDTLSVSFHGDRASHVVCPATFHTFEDPSTFRHSTKPRFPQPVVFKTAS